MRISGGKNPLDATGVHPESYEAREKLLEKLGYTIEDVTNRDYAILKLTCANDTGTEVTLVFDPTKLRIDSNDEVYLNRDDSRTETTTIDGKIYVKKIVFDLSAETTKYVKFYKVDSAQNYSYPGVNETSPITVTI